MNKYVHCKTQEEWDFAVKKLNRTCDVPYKKCGDSINIKNPGDSTFIKNKNKYVTMINTIFYSFQQWCDEYKHVNPFIKKELSEEELLEYARIHYSIGTQYIPAHTHPSGINIVRNLNYNFWDIDKSITVDSNRIKEDYNNNIYYNGKWAEIVKSEPTVKYLYNKEDYIVCNEEVGGWVNKGEIAILGGTYWNIEQVNDFHYLKAKTVKNPDGNGCSSKTDFRHATKEEIDAYKSGIRNIFKIKQSVNVITSFNEYKIGSIVTTLQEGGNSTRHRKYEKSYEKIGELLEIESFEKVSNGILAICKEGYVIYIEQCPECFKLFNKIWEPKVGEYAIIIIDRANCTDKKIGDIFKIEEISNQGNYYLRPKQGMSTGILLENCRKALDHEIPKEFKKLLMQSKFEIGDKVLTFKGEGIVFGFNETGSAQVVVKGINHGHGARGINIVDKYGNKRITTGEDNWFFLESDLTLISTASNTISITPGIKCEVGGSMIGETQILPGTIDSGLVYGNSISCGFLDTQIIWGTVSKIKEIQLLKTKEDKRLNTSVNKIESVKIQLKQKSKLIKF